MEDSEGGKETAKVSEHQSATCQWPPDPNMQRNPHPIPEGVPVDVRIIIYNFRIYIHTTLTKTNVLNDQPAVQLSRENITGPVHIDEGPANKDKQVVKPSVKSKLPGGKKPAKVPDRQSASTLWPTDPHMQSNTDSTQKDNCSNVRILAT